MRRSSARCRSITVTIAFRDAGSVANGNGEREFEAGQITIGVRDPSVDHQSGGNVKPVRDAGDSQSERPVCVAIDLDR